MSSAQPHRLTPDETLALMRLASRGDQAAWSKLYLAHRPWMSAILRGRIPPELRARFDGEDVMQTAFLALCNSSRVLESGNGASLRGFLVEVLMNGLRDELRFHRRRRRSASSEASDGEGALESCASGDELPPDLAEKAEAQAHLIEVLHRLSHEDQDLVCRRFVEGLTWCEVARVTGLSESTARRRTLEVIESLVRLEW